MMLQTDFILKKENYKQKLQNMNYLRVKERDIQQHLNIREFTIR